MNECHYDKRCEFSFWAFVDPCEVCVYAQGKEMELSIEREKKKEIIKQEVKNEE